MSPESPAVAWYSYAVIRIVPRVEREEFVNAGVVLFAPSKRLLCCRFRLDRKRVLALDPAADIGPIARHLAHFEAVCSGTPDAGPIGELPVSERFHWLTAPRSTIIQVSPVHIGRANDLQAALDGLFARYVGDIREEDAERDATSA